MIRATLGQLMEFKESILWKDIKIELAIWKKGFRQELESIVETSTDSNPSSASILMHLGDLNGRIKTVDYLLSLPDMFIQTLEDQKDGLRRDKTT